MLSAVRRSARSWAAAAILFIALVAIVITGFGTGGFGGLGSLNSGNQPGQVLATVGDRRLTDTELSDVINRQYTQARQQQPELGMAEFVAEAFDPLLEQMIIGLAIDEYASQQGLSVSDRMIDRLIASEAQFQDAAGRFDANIFRQFLDGQRITEARLRQDLARSLLQRQLLLPITRAGVVPQTMIREYASLMLERRRGTIGVVPTQALAAGINPTPAEVAAFYQRSRASFIIPERRVIRYAMIGNEQVAAAARATDPEIAAFYRQNAAAYGPRETRDLQRILVPDANAARALAQRLRAGESLAQVASSAGFAVADVTFSNQTREQFTTLDGAAVATAAFQAQQGTIVGPVRTDRGYHVVRVERVNRTPARPLAAVRDEIARTIEQRKQAEALNDLVNRIQERVDDGNSIGEIAQAERLSLVTTPPVTANGQVQGQAFTLTPELQPVLRAGFDIDAEAPEPLIEQIQPNQRFALVAVERVIPAAPPPLAQIQADVRTALIAQQALVRARTVANQIAERINRGTPAPQAYAQAGVALPAPQPVNLLRQEINRAQQQQVPPPLLTLFALPQGRARVIAAPNGAGWFVVHHQERTPGDASGNAAAIREMGRSLVASTPEEVAQQFARSVERAAGAERNEEAVRALRERLLSTAVQ